MLGQSFIVSLSDSGTDKSGERFARLQQRACEPSFHEANVPICNLAPHWEPRAQMQQMQPVTRTADIELTPNVGPSPKKANCQTSKHGSGVESSERPIGRGPGQHVARGKAAVASPRPALSASAPQWCVLNIAASGSACCFSDLLTGLFPTGKKRGWDKATWGLRQHLTLPPTTNQHNLPTNSPKRGGKSTANHSFACARHPPPGTAGAPPRGARPGLTKKRWFWGVQRCSAAEKTNWNRPVFGGAALNVIICSLLGFTKPRYRSFRIYAPSLSLTSCFVFDSL